MTTVMYSSGHAATINNLYLYLLLLFLLLMVSSLLLFFFLFFFHFLLTQRGHFALNTVKVGHIVRHKPFLRWHPCIITTNASQHLPILTRSISLLCSGYDGNIAINSCTRCLDVVFTHIWKRLMNAEFAKHAHCSHCSFRMKTQKTIMNEAFECEMLCVISTQIDYHLKHVHV